MGNRRARWLASAAFVALTSLAAAQAMPPTKGESPALPGPVAVPEGKGIPVITDGLFTDGEWEDARAIAVDAGVTLLVKEHREVVFIGIRGNKTSSVGPSELSLSSPGGPLVKLHVSAQLYEVELPPEGPEPAPRFGLTRDWYANELRRDMALGEQLRKEGKSPIEIILATSYPCDGIEFAIRRAKLPGSRWLARLSVSGVFDGVQKQITFPPEAPERTTDAWLELRLD